MSIPTKIELDVMQANELAQAVDTAVKYAVPTIVVHQALYSDASIARIRRQGRFKLVVPIDWPKGDNYHTIKFRGTPAQCLEADGFEVMLTPGRSESETRAEAVAIDNLVRQLNPIAEVRFVLPAFQRQDEEVLEMAKGLVGVRAPTCVRLGNSLKLQVSKGNPQSHSTLATAIRQLVGHPLKASGNFNSARTIAGCPWAAKFAMNLAQLQAVIKDLERQPDGLREALA